MMRRLPYILVTALLACFVVGSYLVDHHFGYVSAPGGDLFNHAQLMYSLQTHGIGVFFQGYPKLFHALLLVGVHFSGKDPLFVMLIYLPLVIAAAGLMAFFLLRRVTGNPWIGLLALVLTVFVAKQPLQTLYDGGFPNYMSVAVWLPLVLLGTADLARHEHRVRGIYTACIGALLIIATHHFSAAYIFIIILGIAFFVPGRWRRYLGFVALVGFLLLLSPVGNGIRELVQQIVQFNDVFPWVHITGHLDSPNAIIPFRAFPDYFGPFIFWGGFLTMVGVIVAHWRKQHVPLPILLLTFIGLVLLIASQVPIFLFPLRLARDAGVMLVLLTAYGVGVIGLYLWHRQPAWGMTFLIVAGLCTLPALQERITRLEQFEPTMQYTPAEAKLAAETHGEPTLGVNRLLVSIPYPNVNSYFGPTNGPDFLAAADAKKYVLVVESADYSFNRTLQTLELGGYHLQDAAGDPLHNYRLYTR